MRLLNRYSSACASNQYRGLQQFFKWLSGEEGMPDPMARLQGSSQYQLGRSFLAHFRQSPPCCTAACT